MKRIIEKVKRIVIPSDPLSSSEDNKIICGWCGKAADVAKDGFTLVHVAFGSTQERYCFCCDACYEAFRLMYPSRVHRNCYDTECATCEQCIKRYDDETEGMKVVAKDKLTITGN